MKKTFTLPLLLSLLTHILFAQQGSIDGYIQDSTGAPLSFALAKILPEGDSVFSQGAIADEKGHFAINNLQPGTYLVEAAILGYKTKRSAVFSLAAGEAKTLPSFTLNAENQQLKEVVIKSTRPLLEVKTDMTIVNVSGSVLALGEDALEVLRLAPGVFVDNNDVIKMNGKSGVRILINGKETYASGQDLATVLKALPAASIEKIEVITNPSARYDAQGGAGILNIVTKKNKTLGTNGNYRFKSQSDIHTIINTSVDFNTRLEDWNLYGNVGYGQGAYQENTSSNRLIKDGSPNGDKLFDQYNRHIEYWKSPSARFGIDYFAGPKHTFGMLLSGFYGDTDGKNYNRNDISSTGSAADSFLLATNLSPGLRRWGASNFNYRYLDTLGWEMTFDADYYGFLANSNSTLDNQLFNPGEELLQVYGNKYDTRSQINILTAKNDLIRTYRQGTKIEGGWKVSNVKADNDLDARVLQNAAFVPDTGQTNRYRYEETVLAAYASYTTKVKKWGFQAGLRAEHTKVVGISTDLRQRQINSPDTAYLNLFPSVFFTYDLAAEHVLRLSYSRRIVRPNYQDMNPFEYLVDQFTSEKGNPYLRPQFSDSYELTYSYRQAASLSFSYANTRDFFSAVTGQVNDRTFITTTNIGSVKNIGINLSVPIPVSKRIFCYVWLSGFQNTFAGQLPEGKLDAQQLGFECYVNQNLNLNKWNIGLSGFYNAPTRKVLFNDRSNASLNLTVGRSILKKKGYLKCTFNDVFKTQRWKTTVDFGIMQYKVLRTWESQQVSLNFSYNFGNTEVKKIRDRKAGSDTEQSRVK